MKEEKERIFKKVETNESEVEEINKSKEKIEKKECE